MESYCFSIGSLNHSHEILYSVHSEINSAELTNNYLYGKHRKRSMRLYYIHKILQILSACTVLFFIFSPEQLCGLPINQKDLVDSCKETVLSAFFVQKSITPTEQIDNNETTEMPEIVINETYKESEGKRQKRSAVKVLPTDEEQLSIKHHSGTQKVRKSIEKEKKILEKTSREKSTTKPVKTTSELTKTSEKEESLKENETSTITRTSTQATTTKKEESTQATTTNKEESTSKQTELDKKVVIPVENTNSTAEDKEIEILETTEAATYNVTESISEMKDWTKIAHNLVQSRLISVRHDACLKITSADLIGLGHKFISHQLRELRTPIIFVYLSILMCMISCLYVFTKYTVPGRFSTLMSNLLHSMVWAVICAVLFQLRTNWTSQWINSTNFQPEYPLYWIIAEVICFLVFFGCLLETYFADLLHYNLYLEQSAGVYEIIEPPRKYRCGTYESSFTVDFVDKETKEVNTMSL